MDEDIQHAFEWYNNQTVLIGSEGKHIKGYDEKTIRNMYNHLNQIGMVFIIEIKRDAKWYPIGDAVLSDQTLPIVIGLDEYRHKGIGKVVLKLLILLAKYYGIQELRIGKIFDYNMASIKLYEHYGFIKTNTKIDEHGVHYYQYALKLEG